jgi:hypothetical protein
MLGTGRQESSFRAQFLVQQTEWDYWMRPKFLTHPEFKYLTQCVLPLQETGQLQFVEPDAALTADLTLRPLAGHTPGQVGIEIASAGQKASIIADVSHHPMQIDHPEWSLDNPYWSADDPEASRLVDVDVAQAIATRIRIFNEAADDGRLLMEVSIDGSHQEAQRQTVLRGVAAFFVSVFPIISTLRSRLLSCSLETLYSKSDREDITRIDLLHQWLIEQPQKRQQVRGWLRQNIPLKLPVLTEAHGSFDLPGWKNIETNCDRQAIPNLERSVDLLLIQCRHAGRELRIVGGIFSLRDAIDPLALTVAFDYSGHPETCFKHSLFLSNHIRAETTKSTTRLFLSLLRI